MDFPVVEEEEMKTLHDTTDSLVTIANVTIAIATPRLESLGEERSARVWGTEGFCMLNGTTWRMGKGNKFTRVLIQVGRYWLHNMNEWKIYVI